MIVVAASDNQWNELTGLRTNVEWQRVAYASDFAQYINAEAFFCLTPHEIPAAFDSFTKYQKFFSKFKVLSVRVHFKITREVINFIGFKYKPTTYGKGGIFSTSGKPL